MKRMLMILPPLLLLVAAAPAAAQRSVDDGGRDRVPDLDGTWYMNGNVDLPCSIRQRPNGRALFTNENGDSARGEVRSDRVWIPDWSPGDGVQGLEGRIRGDRIVWPDGHYWSRRPR